VKRLVLLPALALAACAGPQTEALMAGPPVVPPRAEVALVPFFAQAEHECGPAALAMALSWSGVPVSPEQVSAQVYTPGREGSLSDDMLAAARRHGRLAVPLDRLSPLLDELAAGHPVVVLQNLGLSFAPRWHYALAVGYDLARRSIMLNSGPDERVVMPLDTFEHTWARSNHWALVVLPPDTLPAGAGELDVARAAAGLERVGLPAEAAAAYRAMRVRWPGSAVARIGLGNALYAMGDRRGARNAFAEALAIDPGSAAARANLAEIQGR
jgi:tetratricopeptide (TPR) repeat protein